jgi:hypothetical protein
VAFAVSCLRPRAAPPFGGLWTAWEVLRRAGRLAGYFDPAENLAGTPGDPSEPVRLSVIADQIWPLADGEPDMVPPPGEPR